MEQVLLLFWRIGPEPGRDRGWTAATGWQWPPARKGKARNIKEKVKEKTRPRCTKKGPGHTSRPLYMMARPEGFEPPTLGIRSPMLYPAEPLAIQHTMQENQTVAQTALSG